VFIDLDTTRQLVEDVKYVAPALVAQTVPAIISWFELTDVLRRLVAEEVNIGDMARILLIYAKARGVGISILTCIIASGC